MIRSEAFGDNVINTIAEYAPNIKDIIVGRQVLTPLDLEREFGLTQGNIFQGELSLEQLFFLRPVAGWAYYRTPIRNLYLCGSATHPGGGIMGANGRIASQVILKEWKKNDSSRFEREQELIMPLGQRVALIGGGHNALITAFYLAKGGFKPVVLERREMVGGGAITEEFHPGFRVSTLAHTVGPLRADVARDLQLEKFDCEILRPDPRVFAPRPDGKALLFYDNIAKTAGGIARLSAKDSEKYAQFAASLAEIAGFFTRLTSITPPAIDNPTPEDLWNLLKTGRDVRSLGKTGIFDLLRWGPMAVADFVAEFFETELLRAAIAARGIFGTALGPWSAGSTAVLLLRAAADAHPVGSASFPRGGLGSFTRAARGIRKTGWRRNSY